MTEFRFLPCTRAFIQPLTLARSGWCGVNPSYEEYYQPGTPVDSLPIQPTGWAFSALFESQGHWILLTETAPDRDYCGCRLGQDPHSKHFFIRFPEERENFPGGALTPESMLPWKSPWRIITVGTLATIVESTLGADLADPPRVSDFSLVRPGRAAWSWVLLKDDSTVFEVQRRFIDYTASMGWEYCLIDADWDRKIGLKGLARLAAYGREKGVGLLVWYNASGDWNTTPYTPKNRLLTHADRIREFSILHDLGIRGVKVDFFGGDGQSMMAYYQDIFKDAAAFGLVVNCHGATLPRGWHRTYPHFLTAEAVRGYEYFTFDQADADRAPQHACFLPFTRNAFDPMDFTPVCLSEIPGKKRVTGQGFELATAVVFWSGIQHYAETPKGMARVPEPVRDFLRKVPATWDDTRFLQGYPGREVILARRKGSTWFVAGINGELHEKSLRLDLRFLPSPSSGLCITDGEGSRDFDIRPVDCDPSIPYALTLKGHGGFVLTLEPR